MALHTTVMSLLNENSLTPLHEECIQNTFRDWHRRHGICQIFYNSKIAKFDNFTREKRVNHDILGQKLRMEDVSFHR